MACPAVGEECGSAVLEIEKAREVEVLLGGRGEDKGPAVVGVTWV